MKSTEIEAGWVVSDSGLLTGRPKRQLASAVATALCFDGSASVDVRGRQTWELKQERQTPSRIVTLHSRHPPDGSVVFHCTRNNSPADAVHTQRRWRRGNVLPCWRGLWSLKFTSVVSSLQVNISRVISGLRVSLGSVLKIQNSTTPPPSCLVFIML